MTFCRTARSAGLAAAGICSQATAKKTTKNNANAEQLANLKEKIAKTKKNLDAAKAAGDRKKVKKI